MPAAISFFAFVLHHRDGAFVSCFFGFVYSCTSRSTKNEMK